MITLEDYETALSMRYSPEIKAKIQSARVSVAGLGGLGSNIAVYLARAGIGTLHLVDFDTVDITNLNRQQYDICDIGTLKTEALAAKIKRFNPFINIVTCCAKVTETNAAQIFGQYPIICEAFDKAESKAMLINTVLTQCSSKIIAASGMAGLYSPNLIITQRITDNLYLCGDSKHEVSDKTPLFAPRVALCAAHQAVTALQIITGNEEL